MKFQQNKGRVMMAGKNSYALGAKISDVEFRAVTKLFAKDASAVEIAEQTGLNRNTVNRYTQELRKRIVENYGNAEYIPPSEEAPLYFGVLVCGNKVVVESIERVHDKIVRELIAGKASAFANENVQKWREYDGLLSIRGHMQIFLNFGKTLRTSRPEDVVVAEDFFIYVKERMVKFYGFSKKHFFSHLKECEFRYNHRFDNIYDILLKTAQERPLFS